MFTAYLLAEFSVLKGELERLLVNNKGLTSQRAAAQHRQSEAAAPQSAGKESTASSADSFLSYCSSSERAAYPGTEFVEVDRNDRMHYMPQRQLADDVAQLLQHVDSAMDAAIVPADASQAAALTMGRCDPNGDKQPAINRLKEQQQQLQQPISRHVSSAHPNSYSVTQPSERNAARELSLKPDQIAMPQPIRHQAANTADWNQLSWRDTHDLTAEIACAESAVAVSRQIVSQPDQVQPNNVTILHAACSVQSPDSLPAAAPSAEEQTTVASSVSAAPATVSAVLAAQIVVDASAESGPQASEAAAPREAASPHKWHTNGLAQEGSQASVSGSSTSQQQAAVSASSPQHSRDGSEQQCKRLHFSECAENIAPAWQHTGSPNTKGKDRWVP